MTLNVKLFLFFLNLLSHKETIQYYLLNNDLKLKGKNVIVFNYLA